MFGSLEPSNMPQPISKGHSQATDQEAIQSGKSLRSESSAGICAPLSSSPQVLLGILKLVCFTIELEELPIVFNREEFIFTLNAQSFLQTKQDSGSIFLYHKLPCDLQLKGGL